ncbi:hypothetical protein ACFWXK_35995 [Streptomyces sp. NPDC059070]|uniref:hypothetical protein n=1 Tax=unclassified Streptomyces TaxID=2593676 RepID=UPI0034E2CBAF
MSMHRIGRRQALRAGLAAAVVTGTGAGGAVLAGAGTAGAAERAAPAAPRSRVGRPGTQLPPVPGMLGDRLANEFWYVFDDTTLFHRSQELDDAYTAIRTYAGGLEAQVIDAWRTRYQEPGYPGNFRDWMAPLAEPLRLISRTQLGVFDQFYHRRDPRLVVAFAEFGQGTLYDPRRVADGNGVHTMNRFTGYHAWHVYARGTALLGIDRRRWYELAPLIGFAWGLQSLAQPSAENPNRPLPRRTVAQQAAYWLPRGLERQDEDFQSTPYPRAPIGG